MEGVELSLNETEGTETQCAVLRISFAVSAAISISGVGLNLFILVCSKLKKEYLKCENCVLLGLFSADFLLGLSYLFQTIVWATIPCPYSREFTAGDCILGMFGSTHAVNLSLYMTFSITTLRFLSIFFPFFHRNHEPRLKTALLVIPFLFAILTMIGSIFALTPNDSIVERCTTTSLYTSAFALFLTISRSPPFALMCVFYIAICIKITFLVGAKGTDMSASCPMQKKAVSFVLKVVGLYIFCWLTPLVVDKISYQYLDGVPMAIARSYGGIVVPFTAVFNPLCYLWHNMSGEPFKRLCRLVKRPFGCKRNRIASISTVRCISDTSSGAPSTTQSKVSDAGFDDDSF